MTPTLLLDSQAVLWFATGSRLLSDAVRNRVVAEGAFVSVLTPVEFEIKERRYGFSFGLQYEELFTIAGLTPLALRFGVHDFLASLPAIHKDPFDRMLLAQAAQEKLVLASSDSSIRRYPVPTFW
jgi:PIN domain nuclease of toxin-antitoxin system